MNYKKIFTIHRHLLKNDMPDDLIPIFFEYLGDIDETVEELKNRHCFYEVQCLWHVANKIFQRCRIGYYCKLCEKMYMIQTQSQFKAHLNSVYHRKQLKCGKDYKLTPPTVNDMEYWLKLKHPQYHSLSKHNKRILLKNVKIKKYESKFL